MTKQTLKNKYLEWNREITKKQARQDEILHKLQDLNEKYGDGIRYCSIYTNVIQIIATDKTYGYRAMNLLGEYNEIEGMKKALVNLALATKNFEI